MSTSFSYTFSQTNSQAFSHTTQYSGTSTLTHSQVSQQEIALYPDLGYIFIGVIIISIIAYIFYSICEGLIYKKAGRKMWPAFIPIYNLFYNLWVLFEITEIPAWLSLLTIIPFIIYTTSIITRSFLLPALVLVCLIGFVYSILVYVAFYKLTKRFSKSVVFYIFGIIIFPYIGIPILAFGKSTYSDPKIGGNNSNDNNPMNGSQDGNGFVPQNPMNQDSSGLNNPVNISSIDQTQVTNPGPVQTPTESNQPDPESNNPISPIADSNSNTNMDLGVNPSSSPMSSPQGVVELPVDNQNPTSPTTPSNPNDPINP